MKVHLYVVKKICSIGWANAQEFIAYVIVIGKSVSGVRSNPEAKSLGDLSSQRSHIFLSPCKKVGHLQKGHLLALAFPRWLLTT